MGVDFSTGMLAQARRARLGAGWVRADARALPCRGFDLAVSFGALGHFLRAERPALFAGWTARCGQAGSSPSRPARPYPAEKRTI